MPLETDDSLPRLSTQETPLMVLEYVKLSFRKAKPGDAVIFINKYGYYDERFQAIRRGIEPFKPYTLKALYPEKRKVEIEEYPGIYSVTMFKKLRNRKAFYYYQHNICTFISH